jgi:cysteinyl-tRNA synthetase
MLKLYNTLTRKKEDFVPLVPGKIRMYVCGMTVYDYCHLGHARVLVVFDMVQRWLEASGFDVTYVRNITDIDDRIIKRALENNESIHTLTDRFIRFMNEDADALGVQPPAHEPRATEYVADMLAIIEQLEEKGLAYHAVDGDVNFAVRKFPGYGKLSGKSLDELRAGERVAVDQAKHDPLDFVLWKHAKPSEPDEAKWPSKWGIGRPGWHIECSAMSCKLLGEHFDIHGGGADLQFPHHENEIAQSEGASGKPFVNYWLHNGFVRVDNEKMSKSLGNFFTIREILKQFDAEVVRFFILRGHYRSPLNYSDAQLQDAKNSLDRLYRALRGKNAKQVAIDWNEPDAAVFKSAMDDDFNTPEAIAVLFKLADGVFGGDEKADLLLSLAHVLGLLQRDTESYFRGEASGASDGLDATAIEALIAARNAARKAKDFKESDRIRDLLVNKKIILEDGPDGTTWRRG